MSKLERDCTKRCKSQRHGDDITTALTKRAVSDEAMASYMKNLCCNFNQVYDTEGRTALHMAASHSRPKLVEWLIRNSPETLINARDNESGYTPLHRSIFYGQIANAVKLIELGASTEIQDNNGCKPLELASLDINFTNHIILHNNVRKKDCDVYVWGTNANYTLGTGARQKKTPDILQFFSRKNMSVKQVCLGKFHTIWVTSDGNVWACGQIGRAGAEVETSLQPVQLRLPDQCVQAAVMLDSTVFWTETGAFYQYTLNNREALNPTKKTPPSIILPVSKPLLKLAKPKGMKTSRVHGAIWNEFVVYTWGLNLGQLGHSHKSKYVDTPEKALIPSRNEVYIRLVAVSEAATVVYSNSEVYLMHQNGCRRIILWIGGLLQICVEAKMNSRVTVMMLTHTGQVEVWHDNYTKNTQYCFRLNHKIVVSHIALVNDMFYITTSIGYAYFGQVSTKKPTNDSEHHFKKKESNKYDRRNYASVKLNPIKNLYRAVSITVDSDGQNFACLQINPNCDLQYIPKFPSSCFSKDMRLLLEQAHENDPLHDVIFKVGPRLFPAHIYIIASQSNVLYKLYQDVNTGDQIPVVVIENMNPEVFERVLEYLYSGTCDVMIEGQAKLKIKREDQSKTENNDDCEDVIENSMEVSAFEVYKGVRKRARNRQKTLEISCSAEFYDPVSLVQTAALRLQINKLLTVLNNYHYNHQDGIIQLKSGHKYVGKFIYNREDFEELADTSVCSKEGQTIAAHKCILAARLEYFNAMFTNFYTKNNSKSVINLPISYNILILIINFLYTDNCPEIRKSDSIDFICSVLVAADQFLVQNLRETCEIVLSEMVTLKNCVDLCQFADTYNSKQLKTYCFEFISLNISNVLEIRNLEILDQKLLNEITDFYSEFNDYIPYRVLTPFSFVPDDEVINESHKSNPVDLNSIDSNLNKDSSIDVAKRKPKSKRLDSCSEKLTDSIINEKPNDSSSNSEKPNDILAEVKNPPTTIKDKWIEVPTTQKKLISRLKAINCAKDISKEVQAENFVTLSKSPEKTQVLTTESQFEPKSPQGSLIISHVGPKLSQKQRKKLQNDSTNTLNQDFSKICIETPAKPKNAWNIPQVPVTCNQFSPKSNEMQFNQILADQKKQKDDSSRIMSKPLHLTQLEDKAIEELERFYNVHEIDEECIIVRRIELKISAPQWVHASPK